MAIHSWHPEGERDDDEQGPRWFWFVILLVMWGVLTVWALTPQAQTQQENPAVQVWKEFCGNDIKKPCPTLAGSKVLKLDYVKKVAARSGRGIFKKTSGENCFGYSCDYICAFDGKTGVDVLVDQETKALPRWGLRQVIDVAGTAKRCVIPGHVVPPTGPEPEPTPDPDPEPEPALCPPDVRLELRQCRDEVDEVRKQGHAEMAAMQKEINDLKIKIANVGCKPGNVLGIRGFHAGCTVTWGPQVVARSN